MQKSPFLSDRAFFVWRAREDSNLRRQKDKAKKGAFDFWELKTAYNGRAICSTGAFNRSNETVEPPFRGSTRKALMTAEQMAAYEGLQSMPERGLFLLEIGVTAELDTEQAYPTYRACVGDVQLPVTGASELTAIERGTA